MRTRFLALRWERGTQRAGTVAGKGQGALTAAASWLAMLLLLLIAFDAGAVRKVAPGKHPDLRPDEGLLLVSFDTDTPVQSARFSKRGAALVSGVLAQLKQGRTTELYVVPAGQYQWGRINFVSSSYWRTYFDLSDDAEYAFEVKPGRITYAGDLVFRPSSLRSAVVHVANRSLPALDWLRAQHPSIDASYPFEYSGHFPDPFPAFYRNELARVSGLPADPNAGRAPPEPGTLPIPPALMWQHPRVRDATLSPDGRLVVVEIREAEHRYLLELIDVEAHTSQTILTSETGFGTVLWESDRVVLAGVPTAAGETLNALRIGEPLKGARKIDFLRGPTGGTLVDLLPDAPSSILYQARDGNGTLVVHELNLYDQRAIEGFRRQRSRDRLNSGVTGDMGWYADGHGRLRAALAERGEDMVLMHGLEGQFREVMRYAGDGGFQPVRLSFDGDLIYGFTDQDRGQRDLVVFDPAQGRVVRTLYSKAGVDLHAALFDDRRTPIGVSYYQDGRLVSEYFAESEAGLDARMAQAFPGRAVMPNTRSRDGSRMLLWVDGSDLPPQLYYMDVAARKAELLEEYVPHLAGQRFVPAQVIRTTSSDGLPLQAFLTLPPGAGKRPLVVMPHGGPIGVADTVHFDRDVQFLASLGYAVLQVNFRGSEGYGRAFREAGHRQFGAGIEDDIDSALRAALVDHPLDETRMCALGISYGGYSAMVSAIRWPDRSVARCPSPA